MALFSFLDKVLAMTGSELEALLSPAIAAIGYELVDVEYRPAGGNSVLRLFIDGPDGIGLDDCAKVSQQVSGILDVEDPIPGEYNLEVSSPGLDRPLRRPADYEKYAGAVVKVKMEKGFVGRIRLKGVLQGLEDECVVLVVDGESHKLPLGRIESARLVPKI